MSGIETGTSPGARDGTLPPPAPIDDRYYDTMDEPAGLGWITFSAIMLGFAGVWAIFEGILALSSSKIYAPHATYVFSDLHTWGWIVTILGVVAVCAAFAIFSGSEWARWFGITVAALNGWGQLMFLHSNPWWSVTMFAVDMLIIYGLAVYGGAKIRKR